MEKKIINISIILILASTNLLTTACIDSFRMKHYFIKEDKIFFNNGELGKGQFDAYTNLDGKWTFYYRENIKHSEGVFTGDFRSGEWQYWYEDGTLMSRGNYDLNERSGDWVFWHPNGKIAEIRRYDYNIEKLIEAYNLEGEIMVKEGEGRYERKVNNKVVESGEYKDSIKVGKWEYLDNNNDIFTEFYE